MTRRLRIQLGLLGHSMRYLAGTFAIGLACMVAVPVLIYSTALCLLWVGIFVLPPELRLLGRLADVERRRAGLLLRTPIPGHGLRGRRLRALLGEPATRRDLRWVPVTMLLGAVTGVLGLGLAVLPGAALGIVVLWWLFPADDPVRILGNLPLDSWATALTLGVGQLLVAIALALWVTPALARFSAHLSAALLRPSAADELTERVQTLRATRAGAVDAHGAELRRIERDLHDGTQASLVAIAMRLGLAERQLADDPQAAAVLLAQAREGAEGAMTELRGVLRSIYPPILADRGLAGALSAVAARCPVPTDLDLGELGRLPAPVEAAAYFVVTESLTNVAKHSGATSASVRADRIGDLLQVEVVDDGAGGVTESAGSGVAGMRRRLGALDGRLLVDSPPGGPTTVRMECPCGS